MESRPRYVLQATSHLAKSFVDHGSADLKLVQSTKLGRNVPRGEGYRLKQEWTQFSQNHCRIYCQASTAAPNTLCWFVEDMSTNGTWVNDVRVAKNSSVQIKEGDWVRLSTPPGEVLEYKFLSVLEPITEQKDDNYSSMTYGSNGIQKRKAGDVDDGQLEIHQNTVKRITRDAPVSPERHGYQDARTPGPNLHKPQQQPGSGGRSSSGGYSGRKAAPDPNVATNPAAALAHFERSNQELRRKLDASRVEVEEARRAVDTLQDQHARELEAAEARVRESDKKAEGMYAAKVEAVDAELASSKLATENGLARVADLEGRLAVEVKGKLHAEKMHAELKYELEDKQRVGVRLQEELETSRHRLTAVRSERDETELRRQQEAEQRMRLQEDAATMAQQLAKQQEALDAAHRAVEQAQQQVQEVSARLEDELAVRIEVEREAALLRGRLQEEHGKEERLHEQLQERRDSALLQRVRLGKVKEFQSTLLSSLQHMYGNVMKQVVSLEEQVNEAMTTPRGDQEGQEEEEPAGSGRAAHVEALPLSDDYRNWIPTSTCVDGMAPTPGGGGVAAHMEMTQVGFDMFPYPHQEMTQIAVQLPLDLRCQQQQQVPNSSEHCMERSCKRGDVRGALDTPWTEHTLERTYTEDSPGPRDLEAAMRSPLEATMRSPVTRSPAATPTKHTSTPAAGRAQPLDSHPPVVDEKPQVGPAAENVSMGAMGQDPVMGGMEAGNQEGGGGEAGQEPTMGVMETEQQDVEEGRAAEEPSLSEMDAENQDVEEGRAVEEPTLSAMDAENQDVEEEGAAEVPSRSEVEAEKQDVQEEGAAEEPNLREMEADHQDVQEEGAAEELTQSGMEADHQDVEEDGAAEEPSLSGMEAEKQQVEEGRAAEGWSTRAMEAEQQDVEEERAVKGWSTRGMEAENQDVEEGAVEAPILRGMEAEKQDVEEGGAAEGWSPRSEREPTFGGLVPEVAEEQKGGNSLKQEHEFGAADAGPTFGMHAAAQSPSVNRGACSASAVDVVYGAGGVNGGVLAAGWVNVAGGGGSSRTAEDYGEAAAAAAAFSHAEEQDKMPTSSAAEACNVAGSCSAAAKEDVKMMTSIAGAEGGAEGAEGVTGGCTVTTPSRLSRWHRPESGLSVPQTTPDSTASKREHNQEQRLESPGFPAQQPLFQEGPLNGSGCVADADADVMQEADSGTLPPPCLQPQPLSASKPSLRRIYDGEEAETSTMQCENGEAEEGEHGAMQYEGREAGSMRPQHTHANGDSNPAGRGDPNRGYSDPLNAFTASQLNALDAAVHNSPAMRHSPAVTANQGTFSTSSKTISIPALRNPVFAESMEPVCDASAPFSAPAFDDSAAQLNLVYSEGQRHASLDMLS